MTQVRRVLIVHDYQGTGGGAEYVVQDLRRALKNRGIEARLLASTALPPGTDSRADNTFFGTTGALRALPEVINPSAMLALRHELTAFKPDVVHLSMFLTQASPGILPLLQQRPTLWWTNEYRGICPIGTRMLPDGSACPHTPGWVCVRERCLQPRGIGPRLAQLTLLSRWQSAIDCVVTPSQSMADELERNGVHVNAVLPHWAPLPSTAPTVRSKTPLVAYAGRLDATKGVDILIRAFAQCAPAHEQARLLIVGTGPLADTLQSLAHQLGVGHRTEFTGALSRSEVQERLAAAWLQVVPSLWGEPFGLVTVEAQLRGTVVVASAVGAQPEIVQHGETGFLFPPGDISALATCFAQAFNGTLNLNGISTAAKSRAHSIYVEDVIMPQLLHLYHSLLVPKVS